MGLFTAFRFLTIIPLPFDRQVSAKEVGRSLIYFPIVGLAIGFVLAGLDRLLMFSLLPSSVANGILVVALVLLTGAAHLDGFIDTCDGFVGGMTPQQRWEVMRDSRVGAFGVVGAFCLLLLKYVSLAGLPDSTRRGALLLMPVLALWAAVLCISIFPYAKSQGLGKAFKEQATWPRVAIATVFAIVASAGFLRLGGLVLMICVGLIALGMATILCHRFAGLTGDTYGAIIESSEVAALLGAILIQNWYC